MKSTTITTQTVDVNGYEVNITVEAKEYDHSDKVGVETKVKHRANTNEYVVGSISQEHKVGRTNYHTLGGHIYHKHGTRFQMNNSTDHWYLIDCKCCRRKTSKKHEYPISEK